MQKSIQAYTSKQEYFRMWDDRCFAIQKYIGCCIYINRNLPFQDLYAKHMTPLEHLFGCHGWCDADWCFDKDLEQIQDIVIRS